MFIAQFPILQRKGASAMGTNPERHKTCFSRRAPPEDFKTQNIKTRNGSYRDWDQWSLIRIKPHSWHLVEQPWRPLALNQLQIQPDGGHWEEKLDWGTSREIEWKTEFEELTLSQKVSLVDDKIKISIYKCVAFCWQARGNQKHCNYCKTAPTGRRKALF